MGGRRGARGGRPGEDADAVPAVHHAGGQRERQLAEPSAAEASVRALCAAGRKPIAGAPLVAHQRFPLPFFCSIAGMLRAIFAAGSASLAMLATLATACTVLIVATARVAFSPTMTVCPCLCGAEPRRWDSSVSRQVGGVAAKRGCQELHVSGKLTSPL